MSNISIRKKKKRGFYGHSTSIMIITYLLLKDKDSALEQYKILKSLDTEKANVLYDEIYK
jgi:hypothetical protein